jgi:hypothetical protein
MPVCIKGVLPWVDRLWDNGILTSIIINLLGALDRVASRTPIVGPTWAPLRRALHSR